MLEPLTKQPRESRLFDMDFVADLAAGETLTGVTLTEQTNLGSVAGSAAVTLGTATVSGSRAQIRISDGTNGESYRISLVVTTSLGNSLEGDGILNVAG